MFVEDKSYIPQCVICIGISQSRRWLSLWNPYVNQTKLDVTLMDSVSYSCSTTVYSLYKNRFLHSCVLFAPVCTIQRPIKKNVSHLVHYDSRSQHTKHSICICDVNYCWNNYFPEFMEFTISDYIFFGKPPLSMSWHRIRCTPQQVNYIGFCERRINLWQ